MSYKRTYAYTAFCPPARETQPLRLLADATFFLPGRRLDFFGLLPYFLDQRLAIAGSCIQRYLRCFSDLKGMVITSNQ